MELRLFVESMCSLPRTGTMGANLRVGTRYILKVRGWPPKRWLEVDG